MAAVVRRNGMSAAWLDLQVSSRTPALQRVRDFLAEHGPRVIGIGGCTPFRELSFRIARLAKRMYPESLVVFGGPHASFTDVDTLQHIPEIDAVVRGEGELTLLEIAQRFLGGNRSLEGIAGVTHRVDGIPRVEPPRPRIQDLSSLPWPDYDLIGGHNYVQRMQLSTRTGINTVTSRGCPYRCSFCSAGALWGSAYTWRQPGEILDEIAMLKERYGIGGVRFYDALISLRRDRLQSLCHEFLHRSLDVEWECEVRADTVDRELLALMKQAGCYLLSIGLESTSPAVLKAIKKKVTPEQVVQTAAWAKELGIRTKVFLMCGNPAETPQSAEETLRFRQAHKQLIDLMPFGPAQIYPGTELERLAHSNGCLPEAWSWSEPYDSAVSESLWCEPHTPVFVQPGYGIPELSRTMFQYFQQIDALPPIGPRAVLTRLARIRSPREAVYVWRKAVGAMRGRLIRSVN